MDTSGKTAPFISIVIPLHNSERFIRGCVESAVRAAVSVPESSAREDKYEILLVDDGSDDGSASVCEELASDNPRIRVFGMEDLGVSAARNLGIEKAEGRLITFLDADDRMFPGMLKELAGVLERTGADIAGCGFAAGNDFETALSSAGSDTAGREPYEKPAEILTGQPFVENRLLKRDTHVWAKLYRREALSGIRFAEGMTIGEDMLFLLDLALAGKTFACTGSPLYFYYRNPEGAMERPYTPSYYDQIRCWELAEKKILAAYPETEKDPALMGRLLEIRTVSAVLVASKIAGSPEKKNRPAGYADDFEKARAEALAQAGRLRKTGYGQPLPFPYKIKLLLLKYFPGAFRILERR